jgi:hypothetical protein
MVPASPEAAFLIVSEGLVTVDPSYLELFIMIVLVEPPVTFCQYTEVCRGSAVTEHWSVTVAYTAAMLISEKIQLLKV